MAEFRGMLFPTLGALLLSGCARTPAPVSAPVTRLVDVFDAKQVAGSATTPVAPVAAHGVEVRRGGARRRPTPPSGAAAGGRPPAPSRPRAASRPARAWPVWPSATASWSGARPPATPSCTSSGRRASTTPTSSMRSRSGCACRRGPTSTSSPARARRWTSRPRPRMPRALPGGITSPIVAGPEMQTYTITPPAPVTGARIRHLADPSHRRRRAPTSRSSPYGSSSAASTWPRCRPA